MLIVLFSTSLSIKPQSDNVQSTTSVVRDLLLIVGDPGSHLVLLHTDVLWEDPPSLTDAKGSAVKMSDRLSPVASTTVACTKNGHVTPEAEKQMYTYT